MKIKGYAKDKLEKLGSKKFVRLMGIDKKTFKYAVSVIKKSYNETHSKGGRPSKFTCYEMMVIFLLYIKRYNAMEDLAFEYEVSKSTICTIIHQVLKYLLKNKSFTLFGSNAIKIDSSEDRLVDVTEIRIERPKYNQKKMYSGKKKYHTMKIQIIKGSTTGFIYEIQIGIGSEHDFHLFKRTFEGSPDNVTYTADLGYLGIDKIHSKSKIPKKKSKNHPLTDDEIAYNKALGSDRIFIEHTNGWIKRFKILSTKFRNDLKFFSEFSVLICAFYNGYIA